MKINHVKLRKQIVEAGRRLYQRGYVASNDGNISARVDNERIIITPTGVSKGFMKPEDLLVIDLKGNLLSGRKKQSSESDMHIQIYRNRSEINSICHAHPPYATGFAVAGISMDQMILPEVIITLGTIPLVEYGTTGTDELYGSISKYIKDYDAFLLANHGALTIGTSILNAYHKMETLEHAAKIQFIAHQLGSLKVLDQKQTDQLINLREKFGIRKDIGIKTFKTTKSDKKIKDE